MNHEQAWQLVRKAFDGISGFTLPQVRLIDLAIEGSDDYIANGFTVRAMLKRRR